jgi:urease accessory protein
VAFRNFAARPAQRPIPRDLRKSLRFRYKSPITDMLRRPVAPLNFVPVVPVFTQRIDTPPDIAPYWCLSLSAEERTRSRLHCKSDEGHPLYLQLPRGLTLKDGDWLRTDQDQFVQVRAKAEPVLTVMADFPLALLQAAYHLGNRHVPLEITANYLRLAPDPVLRDMLTHRGLKLHDEVAPFQPELGAYGSTEPHHH